MSKHTDKVVVLVEENPKYHKFAEVLKKTAADGIDPLCLLDPESHVLINLYMDIFEVA